jgi:hypothetical protein
MKVEKIPGLDMDRGFSFAYHDLGFATVYPRAVEPSGVLLG